MCARKKHESKEALVVKEKVNYHKRFLLTTILQILFIIVEVYYGYLANSMSLISDAIHNASDVLGLLIAWGGFVLAEVKTSNRFTFGLKNTTILAAFINAIFIFVAIGGIGWEAILRVASPQPIDSYMVMIVAAAGVFVNGLSAILFISGKKDINIWGAFIHLAGDAAVSFGVIIASIAILFTGWYWLDASVSLLISLLIVLGSWGLFKESFKLMLHAVPTGINFEEVKQFLLSQAGVTALHDLHIWAISTSETALSVHLVVSQSDENNILLQTLSTDLAQRFGIKHATIQLEHLGSAHCETQC
jgi:cobalt-zinc-cadmium efflux system protein